MSKKSKTPPLPVSVRNRNMIALRVSEHMNKKGIKGTHGGNGEVVCPVEINFSGKKSIKIKIKIVWASSLNAILRTENIRHEEVQQVIDSLSQAVFTVRENFNVALNTFRDRVKSETKSYTSKEYVDLFEDAIVDKLTFHFVNGKIYNSIDAAIAGLIAVFDKHVGAAHTEVDEMIAKKGFRSASGVDDYPGLFPLARTMRRDLIFHVGPTNSGKTYHALQALMQAHNGCYLAPLRLMALEGCDRINAAGIPCNLLTGEESIPIEGANHMSSTIEMMDINNPIDVAIIDEVQMLQDPSRGWAWTKAIIGIPAKVVYMTGSADAIPYVEKIAKLCGDTLTIKHHQRLSPLKPMKTAIELKDVEDGDAIVCFSRKDVFLIRETLSAMDITCAMLYGALGPEVRRAEAERFRSGEAKVLIATDAIGMGLNLPIKRVILSTTEKYDGTETRDLTFSEVKQICGRAGRYDPLESTVGYAGVLKGNDVKFVARALESILEAPKDITLYAMPHWELVRDASKLHDTDNLEFLMDWCSSLFIGDYQAADLTDLEPVMEVLEGVLPLRERFAYLACPVDSRNRYSLNTLRTWAQLHFDDKVVPLPSSFDGIIPNSSEGLRNLEDASKTISLWLWLSMRWSDVYVERDDGLVLRGDLSTAIEDCLRKKALKRVCKDCHKILSSGHRFPSCEECFRMTRIRRSWSRDMDEEF